MDVYRLKGDAEHVYTFEPGSSFLNEDGRTITIEDEWARWSATNENTPIGTSKLVADCWYSEAEPLPLTFDVATDPTPTGFDGRNSAGCRFSRPISKVSVTLTNEDGSIHGQTFLVEPPSEDISFPLSKELPSEMTLELLTPGEYRREMVAISEDGDAWDIVGNIEAALKTVTVEPRS